LKILIDFFDFLCYNKIVKTDELFLRKIFKTKKEEKMNFIIDLVLVSFPVIVLLSSAFLISGIIEAIIKRKEKKERKEKFGYIEIEPDPFGDKGLVTRIHWSE
jgi:hypothetical protein